MSYKFTSVVVVANLEARQAALLEGRLILCAKRKNARAQCCCEYR